MKIVFFSAKEYDIRFFNESSYATEHKLEFLEVPLNDQTALLASGYDVVCVFVNDAITSSVIGRLAGIGVKLIALRCAGFNNVDLEEAVKQGIPVVRVPAYSPYSVAEHTLALILTLNRKTHRAFNRVREGNFSLVNLMGFDLNGKIAGLIGLGKIGLVTAKILEGFGCTVLGYDVAETQEIKNSGIKFSSLDEIYAQADIISLHCPLNTSTYHLINKESVAKMKPGVMLINTSRGALIDTRAVIEGLKEQRIGYLGLDVYEEEEHLFFEDLSDQIILDDVFSRLLSFNNVLITGHQAFLTSNALKSIADITLQNINSFSRGETLVNEVKP